MEEVLVRTINFTLSEYNGQHFDFNLTYASKGVVITGDSGMGKSRTFDMLREASFKIPNVSIFHADSDESLVSLKLVRVSSGLIFYFLDGDFIHEDLLYEFIEKESPNTSVRFVVIFRNDLLTRFTTNPSWKVVLPVTSKYSCAFVPQPSKIVLR